MTNEKKQLENEVLSEVTGGEIEFNEDGTVKDTLKPKIIDLNPATVIPDLIGKTIPTPSIDPNENQNGGN